MGGTIAVESQPKAGTEVSIEVPVQWAPAAPAAVQPQIIAKPNDAPAACRSPLSVLLVEDNPVNRLLASEMLKRLKCTVSSAVTGLEAVDKAISGTWDLVLMDWQLPGIDGLEATRRIRTWESEQGRVGMHIVALTANAMAGDRDRCIDAGCNGYLAKPFSLTQLQAVIDRLHTGAETVPR
jgi:CheY-like chemotaxis protein